MDGKLILTAEPGMYLKMIEANKNWSKIRVLEKIGWISNKLFKAEIIAP
jgi:SH3-like domain-containing protein